MSETLMQKIERLERELKTVEDEMRDKQVRTTGQTWLINNEPFMLCLSPDGYNFYSLTDGIYWECPAMASMDELIRATASDDNLTFAANSAEEYYRNRKGD